MQEKLFPNTKAGGPAKLRLLLSTATLRSLLRRVKIRRKRSAVKSIRPSSSATTLDGKVDDGCLNRARNFDRATIVIFQAEGVAIGQPLENCNLISDDDDDTENTDNSNHGHNIEEPYSTEVRCRSPCGL